MFKKKEVHEALDKYGIPFGFPCNATTGETITCWNALYTRSGDTERLRKAILADNSCVFTISKIPANYLASLHLAVR